MGSGLGLSVVYSIIQKHDGHIFAESELGVGTVFTIYLPASDLKAEEKVTEATAANKGQGKILLMDDEELIRDATGQILTHMGFKVESVKDGEEALALYNRALQSSEPFDAVILDLTIRGGMGGKETIKKILQLNPDVKAVASSGYSNDPVMAYFKDYGFSDIHFKGSDKPEDMCRILNRLINT